MSLFIFVLYSILRLSARSRDDTMGQPSVRSPADSSAGNEIPPQDPQAASGCAPRTLRSPHPHSEDRQYHLQQRIMPPTTLLHSPHLPLASPPHRTSSGVLSQYCSPSTIRSDDASVLPAPRSAAAARRSPAAGSPRPQTAG